MCRRCALENLALSGKANIGPLGKKLGAFFARLKGIELPDQDAE